MSDTNQYFNSKEFLKILHQYEAARQTGSSVYLEAEDLTDIAEYYHSKDDMEGAEEVIDYAIQLHPGSAVPLAYKARKALLVDFDAKKADAIAEEITDKTDLDYYYIKAEIMIADGREDEADGYLKDRLNDISEDDREDYYIDVANLFIDYQQDEKCKEWLMRSEETDADDYKELEGRLAMYAGDFKLSERIFTDLINRDPFSYTLWNQLASSQLRSNNIQEALQSSEYAIAINPDDGEALLTKAGCLLALRNYEQAVEYYRRYTKLCPKDEYGELLYGVTLFNINRPEEALLHMKRAEQIAQGISGYLQEIYQQIAFTESTLKHPKEALEYLQKAMLQPDANMNELLVMKGHIHLENQQLDAAEQSFKHAIAGSGMAPIILLHVAVSFYDNGYPESAYNVLQKMMEMTDSDWKDGYAYLAMCCYELKKKDEFLAALRKACQINPAEAEIVLGSLFPDEMEPKDYYNYIINNQE